MARLRHALGFGAMGSAYLLAAALFAQQPPAKGPMPPPPINPAIAKLDQTFTGPDGPAFGLVAGGENELVCVATERGTVQLFKKEAIANLKGAKPETWTGGHQGPIVALAWNGGPQLATVGADKKLSFWKVPEGKPVQSATVPAPVRCLAMSKDGKWLASGGEDMSVQLWDVATAKAGPKLLDHKDWITCVAFSPDSKQLASGDLSGNIRLWDVAGGKKIAELPAKPVPPPKTPPDPVPASSLVFAPDGKSLLVGTAEGPIHFVNLPDGKILRTLTGHTAPVTALAFHVTGNVLATASKDRTVKLWNPANPQPVKNLEGHKAWIEGLAFINQGQHVVTAGADGMVMTWDLAEPKKK